MHELEIAYNEFHHDILEYIDHKYPNIKNERIYDFFDGHIQYHPKDDSDYSDHSDEEIIEYHHEEVIPILNNAMINNEDSNEDSNEEETYDDDDDD